eukprot:TRINITY_DN2253_c0_g1_i2.p1 TRINITY_DN2253_c0_g1~~TRINITY_DN2253_c0_g1_i2.p1  ORF type:complete len:554 (+),score=85.90 TRINITY_DN2253_c0_g1_i2:32-1663(+)
MGYPPSPTGRGKKMQLGYVAATAVAVVVALIVVQVNVPGQGVTLVGHTLQKEDRTLDVVRGNSTFPTVKRWEVGCNDWTWPNQGGIVQPIEHVRDCEWTMIRGEDLNNPAPETTPLTHVAAFYRTLSVEGEEVDISATQYTASRLAETGLLETFGQRRITWQQRYKGCRACGYSCAIIRKPDDFNPKYPLRKSMRIMAQQGQILAYDDADSDTVLTAKYQGWDVKHMGVQPLPLATCSQVTEAPTFFFKRRNTPYFRNNIAHWIHDLLFPVFMTLHNHMGDAILSKNYYIVPDLDAPEAAFKQNWGIADSNVFLTELAGPGRRLTPQHNHCFKHAIFDCPTPDSMEPIQPFQTWLKSKLKMSFEPVAPLSPTITVMVRCPGGSRYLENAPLMLRTAQEEGYTVRNASTVPVFTQMNTLVQTLQSTNVITSIHGSEIAPMLFMRNGSVVIEIIPNEFRYLDAWYITQAAAAGLHLIRLSPNQTNVKYHFNGKANVCGSSKHRYEKKIHKNIGSQESNYRQLSSSISINMDTWRDVLRLAKRLLG